MRLRAPGLSQQASWLPSMCVCLHAAQSVLSTYLGLYQPVLRMLSRRQGAQDCDPETLSSPVASQLAVTWRQVRRIMLSAFVVIFAYWHGEMVHAEASRFMAMARLLLEYPRWRWGEKLHEAVQTIFDISGLAEFNLHKHMQALLPGSSEEFLETLSHPQQAVAGNSSIGDISCADIEAFLATGPWPAVFEPGSADGIAGSGMGTIEDQTLFGLWGNVEFSEISATWPGDV